MAAPGHSFADRMRKTSALKPSPIESWDDDDFEDALLFKNSAVPSLLSIRSESIAETLDEDFQVFVTPHESPAAAVAAQAAIPIPQNVPVTAFARGSINRLGKKKSTKKLEKYDDDGFQLPDDPNLSLKLKPRTPQTPAADEDDFIDWEEGTSSLGIRFAGTQHANRGARSSSVSCFSVESEEDELAGILLPNNLDFKSRLEKLKNSPQPATPEPSLQPAQEFRRSPQNFKSFPRSSPSPPITFAAPSPFQSPVLKHSASLPLKPKSNPAHEEEDYNDIELGKINEKNPKLNRNVIIKPVTKPTTTPALRPSSSITFTDKTSRIPRPSRTRLTPVPESTAPAQNNNRPIPTTTSAQLLKSKRSAPALRALPPRQPFVPAGAKSNSQSHHITNRSSQPALRHNRPPSPGMRSFSRLSGETPSRSGVRKDSSVLPRHAPTKIIQPQRKRNFGDGHELDLFDDLPTSATKEKLYEKTPRNVASTRTLKSQPSQSRLPMSNMPDRMQTPLPQTPRSPPRIDHTPRFARDTAASRNAREQRLAGTRSRADGPIAPRPMSWQATVASKSPHANPNAHRKKGKGPQLIRHISQSSQPSAQTQGQMLWNPILKIWEGNEEALVSFSVATPVFAPPTTHANRHDRSQSMSQMALSSIQASQRSFSARAARLNPAPPLPITAPVPIPSPPRPALISQISAPRGVQYEGRMVFDPVKMTWLKAPRQSNDILSPSELEDDEDPFAGLDDLKDDTSLAGGNGGGGVGSPNPDEPSFVGEEFDVGPGFIKRQREEEAIWRQKVEGWVGGIRDMGEQRGGWRWAIRELAASAYSAGSGRAIY